MDQLIMPNLVNNMQSFLLEFPLQMHGSIFPKFLCFLPRKLCVPTGPGGDHLPSTPGTHFFVKQWGLYFV